MIMSAREILWRERIEQWYASGLMQDAFARQIGVAQRQISYWAHRLEASEPLPCLLQVQVEPAPIAPAVTTSAIMLRSERGWALTFSGDVQANWLAELVRGLCASKSKSSSAATSSSHSACWPPPCRRRSPDS